MYEHSIFCVAKAIANKNKNVIAFANPSDQKQGDAKCAIQKRINISLCQQDHIRLSANAPAVPANLFIKAQTNSE